MGKKARIIVALQIEPMSIAGNSAGVGLSDQLMAVILEAIAFASRKSLNLDWVYLSQKDEDFR